MNILAINPGSTSTKISLFHDLNAVFTENIAHSTERISEFDTVASQFEFRKEAILAILAEKKVDIQTIDVFVGRGGLVKPIKSGVYRVDEALLRDLIKPVLGEHASNLGGILANALAKASGNKEALIADPVVVDEMTDIARVSGLPEIERRSIFHALNQKAVARRYAREIGQPYESLRLIVAHMGGGTSVGAHLNGSVIDVNDGLIGEGPFTPERSGGVPGYQLLETFVEKYNGDLTKMKKRMTGLGGVVAYLGTNNVKEISEKAEQGNKKECFILEALSYQTAKCIGEMATVLKGKVDAIILTGGVAYSKFITNDLKSRISFIAKIVEYPGENEMEALAENAYYALKGEYEIKKYC